MPLTAADTCPSPPTTVIIGFRDPGYGEASIDYYCELPNAVESEIRQRTHDLMEKGYHHVVVGRVVSKTKRGVFTICYE